MRKAFISGNIGNDAKVKTMPNGDFLIEFSVGNNDEAHKLPDGNYKNITNWFDIKWFSKNGDKWVPKLRKGAQVSVECDIKQETWEKDGQKHSRIVFYVSRGTYPIVAQSPPPAYQPPAPTQPYQPQPQTPSQSGGPEWMF